MDIPLKSQPKVSMVSLLDESKFTLGRYDTNEIEYDENEGNMSQQRWPREIENSSGNRGSINEVITDKNDNNYTSSRAFTKTDSSRDAMKSVFDDDKRRLTTRIQSPDSEHSPMSPKNEYNAYQGYSSGLEDEYIPGLNFGDLVYEWNKPSDQNISGMYDRRDETVPTSTSTSTSNTPLSRDASYLDLNKLHAKVSPQPIALRGQLDGNGKYSFSKLSDFMRASRVPKNTSCTAPATTNNKGVYGSSSTLTSTDDTDHKKRRLKSAQIVDPNTGDINYELVLNSLPPDFNDLPYSQRRRVVKSFSSSIDYSQFSLFAKQYLTDKMASNSVKTSGSSNNGSITRRSRRNSTNTVAGRLLALSTSSPSDKKLEEMKPKKVNVDEKGAIVMGYELGKIIGSGAWGTIRECTGEGGVIRAVKIVKSSRNLDSSASATSLSLNNRNSPTHSSPPPDNPKVLEIFRKEINIWKRLRHENILPLLDHLETATAIFCITNRIFGGTLFELVSSWGIYNFGMQNMSGPVSFLMENQRIRLSQSQIFIKQIISALTYLHEEMGVVHGDLKLENALVDNHDKNNLKVIICDFGMSRVYTSRVSKKSSFLSSTQNSPTSTIRSKSSTTDLRKPYHGGDTKNTRHLFTDDSKIGFAHLFKGHGPSLQSVDLTPEPSQNSLYQFHENRDRIKEGKIDSGLPHSHIGSLPYASPELLVPSPPPLGPSADIWALGVLMYTMCTGKLPFQHPYEPTLRSIITSGDYNKNDLRKACLLQWILADDDEEESENESLNTDGGTLMENSAHLGRSEKRTNSMFSSSLVDNKREREIEELHEQWLKYNKTKFCWLFDIINGSLQANITKRWDLNMIYDTVHNY